MIMKIKLLVALALILSITACKKEKNTLTDPTPQSNCFIKTVEDSKGILVYNYDAENRVYKIEKFDGNGLEFYQTYTYSNNLVLKKFFEGNGTELGEQVGEIHNGRITNKTTVFTSTTSPDVFTYTTTTNYVYEYNSTGFLTKRTLVANTTTNNPNDHLDYTVNYITTYSYENDNLIKKVSNFLGSTYRNRTITETYEYYTGKDKVVNLGSDIAYDIDENYLLGKLSKNLIKNKLIVDQEETNTSTTNYAYTYTYDANGKPEKINKVITEIYIGATFNYNSTHKLTLNCK